MSAQPDPTRQNIIDWCQEDNIPSISDDAKNPQFVWAIGVGATRISVYKIIQIPDRIYFQSQINFS